MNGGRPATPYQFWFVPPLRASNAGTPFRPASRARPPHRASRKKTLEAKTLGAGGRPIEFSGDRPKTIAMEGVGRRRRKTLPIVREAFPGCNLRCASRQEAKELTVAGRQQSAFEHNDGGHAWAIPRRLVDVP